MKKVDINTLEVGDKVYYIASHLDLNLNNAKVGFVTKILEDKVWVRYLGPQGNLTPINNIYT